MHHHHDVIMSDLSASPAVTNFQHPCCFFFVIILCTHYEFDSYSMQSGKCTTNTKVLDLSFSQEHLNTPER